MKILIVDDDTDLRDALVEQLSLHEEFEASAVDTGAKGALAAKSNSPDLVLMDVGLPDTDGREVVRSLRKGGFKSPIIMLTARGEEAAKIAGLDAGARRRGVVDGRDHLDEAVIHDDLDAETAELALGLLLHVLEVLGRHVARMRIEAGEHAVDGVLQELLVGNVLDVVFAHAFEHVAEQLELPKCIRRARLRHDLFHRADGHASGKRGSGHHADLQYIPRHQLRTLPSRATCQESGSTGTPRCLSST